jgi:hypothetical protein
MLFKREELFKKTCVSRHAYEDLTHALQEEQMLEAHL